MTGAKDIRGWVASAAGVAVLAGLAAGPAPAGELFDEATLEFSSRLDLTPLELLVVHDAGRAKILDTIARRQLSYFYGARSTDGTSPTFSFLELYFNTRLYLDRPVIRLRDRRLAGRLKRHMTRAAADMLGKTGRIAPVDLLDPLTARVLYHSGRAAEHQLRHDRLDSLAAPLQAAARTDRASHRAAQRLLGRAQAFFVSAEALAVFPPAGGQQAYLTVEDLGEVAVGRKQAPVFTAAEARELDLLFLELGRAWRRRDAERTNELSAELFDRLSQRAGPTYASSRRRRLERFHNRAYGFTVAWPGYLLAALLLLAAAARNKGGLFRLAGMAVFVLSTLFLIAGVIVRWIISGRGWNLPPLTNQYESVLGAAVMAALAGCVLELIFRKGTLALAAAVFAAAALLCLFFQLGPLQGDINAPEAVLNTSILAWHVATLMVGYGLIAMSLVVSAAYLVIASVRAWRGKLAAQNISAGADLTQSLPQGRTVLPELDRYNLILLQLACWTVAIGDLLGAYWADRAWGRWWGWDVKETWGLMTLLVYLAVIHLRHALPQRTRGLWTAALAIFGALVMGFTWWGVNYLLRGLHSYA